MASWIRIIFLGCKLRPHAEGKDAQNGDGATLPAWGLFRKKLLTQRFHAGRRPWGRKARAAGWCLESNGQILQAWGMCMGSMQCPQKSIWGDGQGLSSLWPSHVLHPCIPCSPLSATRQVTYRYRDCAKDSVSIPCTSSSPAAPSAPAIARCCCLQRPTKPGLCLIK